MIHVGIHTDNWRPLSVGFETACEKIAATGLKHIEFCSIHGQNFISALGYDPGVSLQSNPRAIRRFLDKLGLVVSQIDGSYPMMGPNGSAYGVQYVTQTIRFAAELGCPMVDTVDGAFETPGLTRKEVFRVTCDNYRQCLAWAEDYKIIINVEPHGPYTNDIQFMQDLFQQFGVRVSPLQFRHRQHVHCRAQPARLPQGPPQLCRPLPHQGRQPRPCGGGTRRGNRHRQLRGPCRRRCQRGQHPRLPPIPAPDRLGRRCLPRMQRHRREHPQERGVDTRGDRDAPLSAERGVRSAERGCS